MFQVKSNSGLKSTKYFANTYQERRLLNWSKEQVKKKSDFMSCDFCLRHKRPSRRICKLCCFPSTLGGGPTPLTGGYTKEAPLLSPRLLILIATLQAARQKHTHTHTQGGKRLYYSSSSRGGGENLTERKPHGTHKNQNELSSSSFSFPLLGDGRRGRKWSFFSSAFVAPSSLC